MSPLKRPINPVPEEILMALEKGEFMEAFEDRPPYQRNDYIGWIERAKREETRKRRMNQMLDELEKGDVYMKMKWKKGKR